MNFKKLAGLPVAAVVLGFASAPATATPFVLDFGAAYTYAADASIGDMQLVENIADNGALNTTTATFASLYQDATDDGIFNDSGADTTIHCISHT